MRITLYFCFSKDAKLGKKCSLLDLSRRPSIITPETQDSAAVSSEAKDQNFTCLSKPLTEEVNFTEKVEETKEELNDNEIKTESSSANEFPANMEVDLKETSKEKQGITFLIFYLCYHMLKT